MGRYRHHCLNAAGSRRRNFPIEAPVCLREVPGITMSALPALTLPTAVPDTVLWLPRVIGYKG